MLNILIGTVIGFSIGVGAMCLMFISRTGEEE